MKKNYKKDQKKLIGNIWNLIAQKKIINKSSIVFIIILCIGAWITYGDNIKYKQIKLNPLNVKIINSTNPKEFEVYVKNLYKDIIYAEMKFRINDSNNFIISCVSLFPPKEKYRCNGESFKDQFFNEGESYFKFNLTKINNTNIMGNTLCVQLSTIGPKFHKEKEDCINIII